MNPGINEHEKCTKGQLIPYDVRTFQYHKIEVGSKVAPFLKSAHILFRHAWISDELVSNDKGLIVESVWNLLSIFFV